MTDTTLQTLLEQYLKSALDQNPTATPEQRNARAFRLVARLESVMHDLRGSSFRGNMLLTDFFKDIKWSDLHTALVSPDVVAEAEATEDRSAARAFAKSIISQYAKLSRTVDEPNYATLHPVAPEPKYVTLARSFTGENAGFGAWLATLQPANTRETMPADIIAQAVIGGCIVLHATGYRGAPEVIMQASSDSGYGAVRMGSGIKEGSTVTASAAEAFSADHIAPYYIYKMPTIDRHTNLRREDYEALLKAGFTVTLHGYSPLSRKHNPWHRESRMHGEQTMYPSGWRDYTGRVSVFERTTHLAETESVTVTMELD